MEEPQSHIYRISGSNGNTMGKSVNPSLVPILYSTCPRCKHRGYYTRYNEPSCIYCGFTIPTKSYSLDCPSTIYDSLTFHLVRTEQHGKKHRNEPVAACMKCHRMIPIENGRLITHAPPKNRLAQTQVNVRYYKARDLYRSNKQDSEPAGG